MSEREDLHTLLDNEGIHSIHTAMRHKELAKLGDPLTNLIFSLAYSHYTKQFGGEKVAGKILASALRFAELRHLAPSRLDAHGLGDCVEAMIAYGWLRNYFTIPEAAHLVEEQFLKLELGIKQSKAERADTIAMGLSILLLMIFEKEQEPTSL